MVDEALERGRWGLNPQRPFRMRCFEDAAIVLDEMTGNTHRVSLDAALVLEMLRSGALDITVLSAHLETKSLVAAPSGMVCLDILRELASLGFVSPQNVGESDASSFSS